jgi:general secretion pathway protein K
MTEVRETCSAPGAPQALVPARADAGTSSRAAQILVLRAARRRRGERGVALLMVLSALALLTVMLTEFQDSTSAELGSSLSARDQVKAEYAARSAVNLTRLLIAAEPTIRGPLSLLTQGAQIPVWEYTDVILGAFNDAEGGAAFEGISGMNLAEGRNLGMEDSKINLNTAARADSFSQKRMAEQLLAMLAGIQHDEFFDDAQDEKGTRLDRVTVCSALIDWVDPDGDRDGCDPRSETATTAAPEDSYYQLLDRPYQRKNAGFDSLEELHLVQGVSDDFFSRFFFPDVDEPKSRVVTVWGSGKVNVNSANARTLLAVVCQQAKPETPLCIDPILQQKYLMTSEMFAGAMAGIPIFAKPADFVKAVQGKGMFGEVLQSVGIPPVELLAPKLMEESVTTESQVFSIFATGYVTSGKRQTRSRIHAVIDMRGAPPPGTAETQAALSQVERVVEEAAREEAGGADLLADLPEGFEEGGLAAALLPRPGGAILYYRVD